MRGLVTPWRVADSAIAIEEAAVIDPHLISLAIALQHIDPEVPKLQTWGLTAASMLAAGGRFLACGAGAGAQQARHLVTELSGPDDDRPPLAAATLPARADAGGDCRPGDVLLCLSATEPDKAIAATAAAAGELGVTTWALTGPAPNAVATACAEAICVDAPTTSTVEEVQLAAIHILCAALNSAIRDAIRAGEWKPRQRSGPALSSGRPG
jgi:D-sedoheptulose 7-phosphate isomerase